ncbi:hypothetical protein [Streptomyces sp. NPDC057557]|uniref:hypothetical protein n=1 Tax=Streptomyces sp. NPDC057557 TaxID=3346167 RepID=UPI0036C79905
MRIAVLDGSRRSMRRLVPSSGAACCRAVESGHAGDVGPVNSASGFLTVAVSGGELIDDLQSAAVLVGVQLAAQSPSMAAGLRRTPRREAAPSGR